MSMDSPLSSTVYRKKTLKSVLSQSDHYPYSKYSLKDRQQPSLINNQAMSVTEENSADVLTDLSSLPYMPNKQINHKRNRRFSELKPPLIQQTTQETNSERRNSTPQFNFGSLLPNAFRSNKHQHKHTTKDELNTSLDTSNSSFSLSFNDTMTMRTEPISSSRILNTSNNGSRTNLSISNDTLSTTSHEDSITSLFILDPSQSEARSADTLMLQLNTPLCVAEIYREHFFEYFHTNYCGEFQQERPFIASLRLFYTKSDDTNSTCIARAIIRIPSRNYDVSVPVDGTNEDNILQVLFNQIHLPAIHSIKPSSDPKANEKIYLFDKSNDERQNCKIGFIYQRSDQTDEYDIYNNDSITNEMLDFLHILADRVRLKGFDKYRGDLDIKSDLHGEYSYYTQYNNHEMMFNIAPMIPSTKTDGQCVKRKGLVGNSFVCIVFQESDAEFIPDFISGKVTQIFITVQPIKNNERIYYKIGIWHRHDLTSIIDPPGGIYESDKSFRDYFLTLLLNSIDVAIQSPSLRFCIAEQRQRLKQEELKKLSLNLCLRQILDPSADLEKNHFHIEQSSNSRNDNGRVSPAPTKKRTLSKILSVFTSRSGSVSVPSNNDTPTSPEVNPLHTRTHVSSNREPIRRATSVKHRAAPSAPVPQRMPISYMRSLAPTHSSTLPVVASNSYVSTNNTISSHNNLLNTSTHEDTVRNRSNSSPDDNVNTIPKRPLSTVSNASKEISDTSSVDDLSDDELSDEEKHEHRQTLTEFSLLPSNINA